MQLTYWWPVKASTFLCTNDFIIYPPVKNPPLYKIWQEKREKEKALWAIKRVNLQMAGWKGKKTDWEQIGLIECNSFQSFEWTVFVHCINVTDVICMRSNRRTISNSLEDNVWWCHGDVKGQTVLVAHTYSDVREISHSDSHSSSMS